MAPADGRVVSRERVTKCYPKKILTALGNQGGFFVWVRQSLRGGRTKKAGGMFRRPVPCCQITNPELGDPDQAALLLRPATISSVTFRGTGS